MALVNYVLRQFFKAVEADPFVLVEVSSLISLILITFTRDRVSFRFFMCAGVLPEEPKSMEEVLQLGTRVKDEGQGSRRAVPTGCPSQERVHVERTTRDCHGCPSGGWPERANRVGEGGLSVPNG